MRYGRAFRERAVARLLLLATVTLALLAPVGADPTIVDNLDGSLDAVWAFTNPPDYTVADVLVSGGVATLRPRPGAWDLTSASDFGSPDNATNVDLARWPGNVTLLRDTAPRTVLAIQPGPEGEDAWLDRGSPTTNFGSAATLVLDGRSPQSRPVLRFDLTAIPPNAVIDAAVLSLYQTAGIGATFTSTLHRVSVPWDEDQVTWNERFTGISWANQGGDFDGQVFAQLSLDNTVGWRAWNITHLADLWYRGRVPNLGLILSASSTGPNSDKTFASSDYMVDPSRRPRLNVTYRTLGASGEYVSAVGGPGTPARWTTIRWTETDRSLSSDEFSGPGLDPKWTWTNAPPSWDVGATSPGRLQIVTATGVDLDGATFTGHVLAQPIAGDFTAVVQLESSPSADGQKSGLIAFVGNRDWYAVQKVAVAGTANWQVRASANGTGTLRSDVPGASNPAWLRIQRTGNTFTVSTSPDGVSWTVRDAYAPNPEYPFAVRLGLFAADGMSGVAHTVDVDFMRVSQATDATVAVQTRTGNSSSVDATWTPWSAGHATPGGSPLTGNARYVQFRLLLSVGSPGHVPAVGDVHIGWIDFPTGGTAETADLAPNDLRAWGNFTSVDVRNGQSISYAYSLDGGSTWTTVSPPASLDAVSIASGRIRFRASLSTSDPAVTPEVHELRFTYRLALEAFDVAAPASAIAGVPFAATITAKGPGNATLSGWAGTVFLEAMLPDGVTPGGGLLAPDSAVVTSGGTVTVTNLTYTRAEAIRIRASIPSVAGVSAPILVSPGGVARVQVTPPSASVAPFGSVDFAAAAFDDWDNPIPGASFDWSVSGVDGRLAPVQGDRTTFTAGGGLGNGTVVAASGGASGVAIVSVSGALAWWQSPFLPLALLGFGVVMAVFGQRMRWRPAKAFLVDERGELIREFTLDAGCSVTYEEVRAAGALDAVKAPVKVSRYRAQTVRGDALAVVLLAYGPVSLEQVEFAREMLVNVQDKFEDRVLRRLEHVRALESDLAVVEARSRGVSELMDAVLAGEEKVRAGLAAIRAEAEDLKSREEQLQADRERLEARLSRAEEAERTLAPREADLRSREALVEERMAALDARDARIAGLEAALRSREASVTEREAEATGFKKDLEARTKAIEEGRRALEESKAALAQERASVAEDRRRIDEEREEFESRMTRMAQNALQRTEALNAQARSLQIEMERLEKEKQDFAATREADIEERNRDFQNRLKIIQEKAQALLQREEDLRKWQADLQELEKMLGPD